MTDTALPGTTTDPDHRSGWIHSGRRGHRLPSGRTIYTDVESIPDDTAASIDVALDSLGLQPRDVTRAWIDHDGRCSIIERCILSPVTGPHRAPVRHVRLVVPLPGHGQSRRRMLNRHTGS